MPKQIKYEKPKTKSRISGRMKAIGAQNRYVNWSSFSNKQKPIGNATQNMTINRWKKVNNPVGDRGSELAKRKLLPSKSNSSSVHDYRNASNYVNSSIAGVAKAMKDNSNTAKSTMVRKNIANSSVNSAKSTMDSYLKDLTAIADRNNAINIGMNRENNQFNADQAAAQRDWESLMSNTAHQREVADLKAAGLNPILSAGGMGAATPSGASASATNFSGTDNSVISALSQLASNAMSANATMTAAQTSANAQMQSAMISGNYNYMSAVQAAAANVAASNIAAGASMYGADQNRAAMMYGADQSRASSMYGSNRSYEGTKYTADKQRGNTWIQTVGNILGNLIPNIGMVKMMK